MHHYNVALLYEEPLFLRSLTTALQGRGHSLLASVPNTAALKLALAMRPGVQLALFSVASAMANNYDLLHWSMVQLPTTRILLLGREPEDPALAAAFFAGASGYYCTRDPEDTLMHHVLHVAEGALVFPPGTWQQIRQHPHQPPPQYPKPDPTLKRPSPAQCEFLQQVADPNNYTYPDIAKRMGRSLWAVQKYRRLLFERFNIKRRRDLEHLAWQLGLMGGNENGKK